MMKRRLLAILISAIFVFGFTRVSSAASDAKELDTEKSAVTFAKEVERGGYKIVTTQELKNWIDQKKNMLIVDTMPEASFKKEHIPGAANLELPRPEMTKLDDKTKSALETLLGRDLNRTIVFYCGFVECTRSHNGALWATRLGYKNAYRQPGGIRAWNEAKYPVEKVQ